jgi:hypothetical protein
MRFISIDITVPIKATNDKKKLPCFFLYYDWCVVPLICFKLIFLCFYIILMHLLKIKIYISKKLSRKKLFLHLISKTESLIIPATNSVRYRLTSLINISSLLSPPPTDCIYFYMNIPQVNIHRRKHPRPWSRLLYVIQFFFSYFYGEWFRPALLLAGYMCTVD